MIIETNITLYRAKCDQCGSILEKKMVDITVFDLDEDELQELIEEKGWKINNNMIFCSKCIDAKA